MSPVIKYFKIAEYASWHISSHFKSLKYGTATLYQKWSNNYHLMDDNSFPKGSVISCSLTLNCTGISQRCKCLHQDIVSHKISLVTVAFSNEQVIFTPPPETLWSWMHFGRLSSTHRGHGTGQKLEGLFIFYMCWAMLFPGVNRSF